MKKLLLLSLLFLVGCGGGSIRSFYIYPNGTGYIVRAATCQTMITDPDVSKSLSLPEAEKLADKLNSTLSNNRGCTLYEAQ